jgi:peptidoglycan/xylan/chitin deacetylase (PgdA/CDA1 family)
MDAIVTTSWDDGHALDLRLAGLLKHYGVAGTLYIAPDDHEIAVSDRLTQKEVATLAKDFEIGAHTMTHPDLRGLDEEAARSEITRSKETLEAWTKKPVTSFCYPRGAYGAREVGMVKDAGFSYARTVRRGSMVRGPALEARTSVHAYDHVFDFRPWDTLAIALFNRVVAEGGVFHLWGHSWEIDAHHDWDRLERVLKYIGGHDGVLYRTNGHLI